MRISHTLIPTLRAATVAGFVALCALILGFLWLNAGGRIPLISDEGYRVDVTLPDVDNLAFQSDVRMAGVDVGKIESIETHGREARVTLELEPSVAPLHEGATITVRNKTMIEETYLEVVDGDGSEITAGTKLPDDAGTTSVQLNDVLTSLDESTRDSLSQVLRSSGAATSGTKEDVDATLHGLGDLGRDGGVALEALADQSDALSELTRNSTVVLSALDTQEGRIAQLAQDADLLTRTIADNSDDVESLMRSLPGLLDTTREASAGLSRLSDPLGRVASNLDEGSEDLSAALLELPDTASDLRGLLPALDSTLQRAPSTLTRVDGFTDEAEPVVNTLQTNLADLNPMLAYLKPYGPDVVSYLTNFTQFASGSDVNGNVARVKPVFNANSLNLPVPLTPLTMFNPYPAAGTAMDPQPFSGTYPRVERDSIPR
ncbi:MlaD family protein [Aeromicrobium sp. CTD01-1L150]|uniref:MlaD family protein n=1 Tax=Aeromicrobium sp. CTD01-1L150 TaxID=3341830 RepID=UPI0035BF4C3F